MKASGLFTLLLMMLEATSALAQEPNDDPFINVSVGVRLKWTSPGDDGRYGTAKEYDLRYSRAPITEANWADAVEANVEPKPQLAGAFQSCYVPGLVSGTRYYFAIRTVDEAGNWSGLSNVVSKMAQVAACGDITGEGMINVGDIIFLRNCVFKPGVEPVPLEAFDINCDGGVNVSDIVYLTNYIYIPGSPKPCEECP